ncbi:MAG: hypothetical protein AAF358_23780 [Pseudomonadota bacterium]
MNEPFLFLSDAGAVDALSKGLAQIGVEVTDLTDSHTAYSPAVMCLFCPRLNESSLTIDWYRSWWPDGENQEDSRVTFMANGEEVHTVEIGSLLREKLSQPLRQEIAERLVSAVAQHVGQQVPNKKFMDSPGNR